MSQSEPEFWWRAEVKRYANYDPWAEFEQPSGSHPKVNVYKYKVVRHTPKGVRLVGRFGDEHYVRGTARKQYAVPTLELAIKDAIIRAEYHVSGCKVRLRQAEENLEHVQRKLQRLDISIRHD